MKGHFIGNFFDTLQIDSRLQIKPILARIFYSFYIVQIRNEKSFKSPKSNAVPNQI